MEEPHRSSTEELHQSRSCCGLRKRKKNSNSNNHKEEEEKPKMQTTDPSQPQSQQMMSFSFSSQMSREDEEMARSALSAFRAKEDEIEKRKMEVRERVKTQLGRVEEENRRLANIREVCLILVFFQNRAMNLCF